MCRLLARHVTHVTDAGIGAGLQYYMKQMACSASSNVKKPFPATYYTEGYFFGPKIYSIFGHSVTFGCGCTLALRQLPQRDVYVGFYKIILHNNSQAPYL